MLSISSGQRLAVGQWRACWSGLPRGSTNRGKHCMLSYHICHIYRTWKSIHIGWGRVIIWRGQGKKGWDHFYGGSWPLKAPYKDFNLEIVGGLVWIKWLKMGQRKGYISGNYSCTTSFSVKILLVKLKKLYVQYAWISIMKKTK